MALQQIPRPGSSLNRWVERTSRLSDHARRTDSGRERTDAERLSVEDLAQVSMLPAGATVRVSAAGCGLSTVGTGFAVNGMLLTNSHVVGAATAFSIGETGRSGAGPAAPLLVPVRGNAPSVDLAFGPSPLGQELVSPGRDPVTGELVVLTGYGGGRRLSIVEARVSNVVAGEPMAATAPPCSSRARPRSDRPGGRWWIATAGWSRCCGPTMQRPG